MLETIYIVVAVLGFFAQLRNGFFNALITAALWPIVIGGMGIFIFLYGLYTLVKR
jgi:hypothetical protein